MGIQGSNERSAFTHIARRSPFRSNGLLSAVYMPTTCNSLAQFNSAVPLVALRCYPERTGTTMENGSEEISPLGVALVGAGMVAKTHLAAILGAHRHVTLRGLYSRTSERVADLLKAVPADYSCQPRPYGSLEQCLMDDSVDAAIVVTPPNVREELIQPLAEAGKHILLEKPVARNLPEAEQVVCVCEQADVQLGIVFQHRFRAASQMAKRLVNQRNLGRLGAVEVSVPWWREQSYYDEPGRGTYERDGGGVLINQAIHTIDLFLSLTGPVESVQAMVSTSPLLKMEAENFVVAGLKFENGAVGSLTASTCSFPGASEVIVLHFETASLRLERGVLTVSWRDGQTERHGEENTSGGGADPMAFTHAWHQAVLEDFAEAVGRGTRPTVTGHDALAAHRLIEAIERSGERGQVVQVTN